MFVAALILEVMKMDTIDYYQPPAWYKGTEYMVKDSFPVLQLMIGIRDEDCIHTPA